MSFKEHENKCPVCTHESRVHINGQRAEGVAMLVLTAEPGEFRHYTGVRYDTLNLKGNGILEWEAEDGSLVNLVNPGTYTFVFV